MRDFQANDRVIGSELRGALVDAPERATYVVSGTAPTSPTDLEVGCDAGTVVVDGSEMSVSAQTESVSDITGQVTQTAYRYHTLSVDATGTLVVRSSPVGEFDASDPDAEPITQVTEPSHDTGEVFLGTAFQVEGAIERVFDGRYVLDGIPNSVITQGAGSGLDADTVRGNVAWTDANDGAGSGLDADTLRGNGPVDLRRGAFGDGSDGEVVDPASLSGTTNARRVEITTGHTTNVSDWAIIRAQDEVVIDGTIRAVVNGTGGANGFPSANSGSDGVIAPTSGAGGSGGSGGGTGGSGGDATKVTRENDSAAVTFPTDYYRRVFPGEVVAEIESGVAAAGAGGGGGGDGEDSSTQGDGNNGSFPGGGGGGARNNGAVANGGDGGDGGGLILIVAPSITGSGVVDASGENGADGGDSSGGGGGGGGAGCGGLVGLYAYTATVSTDVSGGVGGIGGSGSFVGGDGADGGDGIVAVGDP